MGNGRVKAPVIVAPGHPDNSVTVYLGYGRECRPRGLGPGLQCLSDSQHLGAVLRHRLASRKIEGKWGIAITKSHYQDHRGEDFRRAREPATTRSKADEALGPRGIIRYATLDEFKANPNFAHEGEGRETPDIRHVALPQLGVQRGQRLGHVHRHEQLHGLQCLHRELLCREQHRRGGQAAGAHRPQHAVAAHRHLLRRRSGRAARALPAHGLPALRKRALRAGLPGGRHGAHAGRPEHDGLQPLRGHPLLLQQLPLQGAPLQLPALLATTKPRA